MKKKILTIQGSSLKKINIETDTTFFLGLEAQKRNYDIYYYEPNDLSFVNGKVKATCFKVQFNNNKKKPIEIIRKINLELLKSNLLFKQVLILTNCSNLYYSMVGMVEIINSVPKSITGITIQSISILSC